MTLYSLACADVSLRIYSLSLTSAYSIVLAAMLDDLCQSLFAGTKHSQPIILYTVYVVVISVGVFGAVVVA